MSSFYHGDAAAAAVITSGSFQVERWVDPKGLIKSIDVLEVRGNKVLRVHPQT